MSALQSVADAIARMLNDVGTATLSTETLPLSQLDGRILAVDIVSPMTVPAFDNSAMDGYALRAADAELLTEAGLTVMGTAHAGHPFAGTLAAGQAVRIMTGAELPAGADTVLMQEVVERNGDTIHSSEPVKAGANVRIAGEDIRSGELLLARGQRLTPLHIGLFASVGLAEISVYRRLKVAVFSTGDELCQPGQPRRAEQIYDSNRFALRAMLERLPVEIIRFEWLPDDLAAIRSALGDAAAQADVLITSAGVSVGDADFTKQVIDELGQVNFWKVAMKPGKPFAFGRLQNCWFFGLPGNPVSSLVTLDQLAQPVLRRLSGEHSEASLALPAVAATGFRKQPGRQDFQRSRLSVQNGQLQAEPCGNQGSGLLRGFAQSNGYTVLEAERGHVDAGETVTVQPFGPLLM